MFDLNQLFLPVELANTDDHAKLGNRKFNTRDRVYLVSECKSPERIACSSYAVMCGANFSGYAGEAEYWYRTAHFNHFNKQYRVDIGGKYPSAHYPLTAGMVIRPAMHVDLDAFREFARITRQNKVNDATTIFQNGLTYMISFGLTFPQDHTSYTMKMELNNQQYRNRKVTGASYTGAVRYTGVLSGTLLYKNTEYQYNGANYVKLTSNRLNELCKLSGGDYCPDVGETTWVHVQPLYFIIRNWDALPRDINPDGSGQAQYMDVIVDQGILCLPFHTCGGADRNTPAIAMWQNSLIRAYLNGYDNHQEIDHGNGNPAHKTKTNFDFSGYGFLFEASQNLRALCPEITIGTTTTMTSTQPVTMETPNDTPPETPRPQPNPYGFSYDNLDNDDLLKLYIQSKTPVFLHGPSGVGKSSRVRQIDPDPTHITLRPQMNPEEIDGVLDRETGNYIAPLWYQQLCEKCTKDPEHIHTLFIDELTNVKPTVQSLVYSIILDRAGKDGLWRLPENSVVVAAGNENADNLAAYPLTNALFRRLSHIYYQVDKNAWLDWATGVQKLSRLQPVVPDKTPHARIHPAVVAFVASQKDDILNQDLDEENPKIVTDPRKWEIASNVLYSTKNPKALQPAIGTELTASFVDFVQSIHLTVADVVNHTYDSKMLNQLNFAQRMANVTGLCHASEKDLPVVRNFIQHYFGQEARALFDSLWIRNDPERAAVIGELDENTQTNQQEQNHDLGR